jgi:hypothetical protein
MSPYEEKCLKRNIATLELIVRESKEKRDSLEKCLISQARLPYCNKIAGYADNLMNSITVESSVIDYMEKQIIDLKLSK